MVIRTKLEQQYGRQGITKLTFLYDFWFNKLNRNSKNLKKIELFFFGGGVINKKFYLFTHQGDFVQVYAYV